MNPPTAAEENPDEYRVVIFDNDSSQWMEFCNLIDVYSLSDVQQINATLADINSKVNKQRLFAAGFLSYESAPAFDEALKVRSADGLPLLWFGLFQKVRYHKTFPLIKLPNYSIGKWTSDCAKEEYSQTLQKVRQLLEEGETYQVNISYRQRAKFTGSAELLLTDMLRGQKSHYGAYIDLGDYAICSGSPELFFRKEGLRLLSRPMKGTAQRGLTLVEDKKRADDLHHSEKNRAENVMIVDMVRNDMGRVARAGSVCVPQLYSIEKYPTVWQMTSTVECQTDVDFPDIFGALFPCASITGAPKVSTMGIIADLERSPRNIYTGSIGYIAPEGRSQFNVAIRTALIDKVNSSIEYGTGGGIVWDSDFDEEYNETIAKTAQIITPWPEFQLLETLLWEPDTGYFLLEYHFERLSNSAEYFGYRFDEQMLREKLEKTADEFEKVRYRVRLLLDDSGEVQLDTMQFNEATTDSSIPVELAPEPIDPSNRFLYHKTTHRPMYEFGTDTDVEYILWNPHGEITESAIANIVIEWNGRLITPLVKSGLLPGTMRQYLLEEGKIFEQTITMEMLEKAEQIYLINSVRGWRRARLVNQ